VEFLVGIEIALPPELSEDDRARLEQRERERGLELLSDGAIVRIWRVPGRTANIGVWSADDATELHRLLASLPLFPWMDITVTPLARHPLEQD
jgi:muconolactone delta-isomerase